MINIVTEIIKAKRLIKEVKQALEIELMIQSVSKINTHVITNTIKDVKEFRRK